MNKATKLAATFNSQSNPFHRRACLFHCTPVSERRRRTQWDYKFNEHYKRLRKQSLFHNASEFAEHLFQIWQSDGDEHDQPSDRGGSSWFRPNFREDTYNKKGKSRNRNSRAPRRDFDFCDDNDYDDVEFETIFRSAFGGNEGFYWSFTLDGERRYRSSSSYSNSYRKTSGRWKYESDGEYDSSSDYYAKKPTLDHMTSNRSALGLSISGPLNLDDVKNAYRACALKWHPDRHQGSTKTHPDRERACSNRFTCLCIVLMHVVQVVAEEKFKVCSAAYQSLCDKLVLH